MTLRAGLALALTALAVGLAPPAHAQSGASHVSTAQAAEAELLANPAKLRLRHNLERLERLWEEALAKSPAADQAEARAGRLRAARLLARWSGRPEDRARAQALAGELSPPKPEASPPAPKPERAPTFERTEIELEEGRILVTLPGLASGAAKLVGQEVLGRGTARPRVYFDLRPLVAAPTALVERPIDDARVRRLRVGQTDDRTVRFVFDLEPGVSLATVGFQAEPTPAFVIQRPEAKTPAPEKLSLSRPPSPSPAPEEPAAVAAKPEPRPGPPAKNGGAERAEILAQKAALDRLLEQIASGPDVSLAAEPEAPTDTAPPTEPQAKVQAEEKAKPSELSLARSTKEALRPRIESPLRIRRVVVDAGHGGKDVGAVGRRGTREKDVNLALALALGRRLEKELGMEVVYTRTKDKFVSLERRTQIANAANADLFISVHSNANRNRKIRGLETYYLNTTSSRYANRLAHRENRDMHDPELIGDDSPEEMELDETPAPLPGGAVGRDLKLLLADLAMRSAAEESRRLAGYIQHTAVDRLRQPERELKDLGVKKALFFVLLGVRMPAVLVESGFLSHEEEEKALADPSYRDRLAAAIAQGVRRYVDERHEIAARF